MTIFTTGVFDLLHYGHINLLNRAKELGDFLIVGLVDDEAVRKQKGEGRPVLSYDLRKGLLYSLKSVDMAVKLDSFAPDIDIFNVDLIAKGEDQDHVVYNTDTPIVVLRRTDGVSTTDMINNG